MDHDTKFWYLSTAITLKFFGEAKTSWNESRSFTNSQGKRQTTTIRFRGHEIYLDSKQYLLGRKNGNDISLLPGEYVYPFSCVLPPSAPCSFEGTYGHVRYIAKVVLDRPWKFDQGTKLAFTVISPLDLNHNHMLRVSNAPLLTISTKKSLFSLVHFNFFQQPVNLTLEKTFCCLFCQSGPLTVTMRLPSTGFVPGHIIPIFIDIDNASNVEVEQLRFSLRQISSFKATSPTHKLKKAINVISVASIGSTGMRNKPCQTVDLSVPSLPPSNLLNCTLIDLEYDVKVWIKKATISS